jgi:aspartyl protease family protein
MSGNNTAQIIYLVLLLCAVGTWVFVYHRQSLGKTLQQAISWALIFVGVIAAYGLWEDVRGTVTPSASVMSDVIEVPRANDGHYYLPLRVNGTSVTFMVDTGASQIVLTQKDAQRAGLDMDDLAFTDRAMTANGEVRTAPVWLEEIGLGEITDTGVKAWVNEGAMEQSLLGMSYLRRYSKIEITGHSLVLQR